MLLSKIRKRIKAPVVDAKRPVRVWIFAGELAETKPDKFFIAQLLGGEKVVVGAVCIFKIFKFYDPSRKILAKSIECVILPFAFKNL